MKALEPIKKADKRCIAKHAMTILFIVAGAVFFRPALLRTLQSIRDLAVSIVYYFVTIFGGSGVAPTVTNVGDISRLNLPATAAEFWLRFYDFVNLIIDEDNFKAYLEAVLRFLADAMPVVVIMLPLLLLLRVVLRRALKRGNNNYGAESKPLRVAKWIALKTYIPIKKRSLVFYNYMKDAKRTRWWWRLIWLVNLNVLAVIFTWFAYVLYAISELSLAGFYDQFQRLVVDLGIMLSSIPGVAWVVIAYIIFDRWRREVGLRRLEKFEKKNNELLRNWGAVVLMIVGTMGLGKTTLISDMGLTQTEIFREDSLRLLFEHDLRFPNFPWIVFENDLKKAIDENRVYNMPGCVNFVKEIEASFNAAPSKDKLYGYDYKRYGLDYDDKLKVVSLFKVLENYARAYLIYTMQMLLIGNYSIREDSEFNSENNFPLWDKDEGIFERDSRKIDTKSRYAHVLDFDMMRLGKKVVENNEKADAFEFGVVAITEVGKERGNQYDTRGMGKDDDFANQMSDLFNLQLKMARHAATIDYKRFVRYFLDEQREQSLGADVRELCSVVTIDSKSGTRLAMPFFFITNFLYNHLLPKFEKFYYNFRYKRGDNTLFVHLCKTICVWLYNRRSRIYNQFSYSTRTLKVEGGKCKWTLMSKKIFSERFATDAFSDFFTQKAARSAVGLKHIPCYGGVHATLDEFMQQHSHFINDISKHFLSNAVAPIYTGNQYEKIVEESKYQAFYELMMLVIEKREKAKRERKAGEKIPAISNPTGEELEKRMRELIVLKCKEKNIICNL